MYTCVIFISEKLESNKGPLPDSLVSLSDCLSLQSNCCLGRNGLSTEKKQNHRRKIWRKWAISDRFNNAFGFRSFQVGYAALLYPLGGVSRINIMNKNSHTDKTTEQLRVIAVPFPTSKG